MRTITEIYGVTPGNNGLDIHDQINERILQLYALLAAVTGEGTTSFASLNEELQGNYLWACESLAGQCVGLMKAASKLRVRDSAPVSNSAQS